MPQSPQKTEENPPWAAKALARLDPGNIDKLLRDEIKFFATNKVFQDTDTLSNIGYEHEDFMQLAKSLRLLLKHLKATGTINTSDLEQDGVTVADVIALVH